MKTIGLRKIFIKFYKLQIIIFAFLIYFSVITTFAQSTRQDSPTPVTSNEINGVIRPRAIGDPRLTNYYYTFNGNQGDVFVNVVTNNLDGDIDIFTMDGLEPLTKIPVFSGVQESETGRVIYLRKFEKLILRIQGRTPNDEPASFQIKFAGSFVAMQDTGNGKSVLPDVNVNNQGEARVSSVGTILEVYEKPIPSKKENVSKTIENKDIEEVQPIEKQISVSTVDNPEAPENVTKIEIRKEDDNQSDNTVAEKKENSTPKVIVTDTLKNNNNEIAGKSDADRKIDEQVADTKITVAKETDDAQIAEAEVTDADTMMEGESDQTEVAEAEAVEVETSPKVETTEKTDDLKKDATVTKEIQPVEASRLANISLIVKLKNKTTFERSMDKITWFNVDKGILTIVLSDGLILKFSMLDVEKMTFETKN